MSTFKPRPVKQLADAYAEAWGRRDFDAIMSLHTTDSVFQMRAGQPEAIGLIAVRAAFTDGMRLVPDARFE